MTREALDSDRVNYLVWRYLQESNFTETALTLQREWKIEEPQHLDFAPHVKHHALVSVLQRGLLYHDIERQSLQNARAPGAAQVPGFFGPLLPLSPPAVDEQHNIEIARKRQIDQRQHAARHESPAKRAKLSNGYENGFETTPMDVDDNTNGHSNGHAYPSPQEPERVPTPVITNGPERGTQVDKVAELSSDTTFLTLSDDSGSSTSVILHCEWNPSNPTILAAAGTEPLVRLWTISRGATSNEPNGHVNGTTPQFRDIVEEEPADLTSVSAFSWSPDGAYIAVATESPAEDMGRVTVWDVNGTFLHTFTGFEAPVISLKWNPAGHLILAVMPDNDGNGTAITVFSANSQVSPSYSLPNHGLANAPLEIIWTGEYEFMVCGGSILWAFQCADGIISLARKYETREDHGLLNIAYDPITRLIATGSESGVVDIWDQQDKSLSISAHQGCITSLAWQPISNQSILNANSERLLASSGDDGIINVWNARAEGKAKCFMTMESAVVALAFTPDGVFLAGATNKHILIWRVEDVTLPRARWVRDNEPGWESPRTNGSSQEEDHHCLCWDAEGQKLAYAVNSQVAVIKWRPSGEMTAH